MELTTAKLKHTQLIIVFSGPSGAGKDSVLRRLLRSEAELVFVVTTTTRPMREEETQGFDYIFVTRDEFTLMVEAGEFIEHAVVYGEHKGVSRKQIEVALESGKDVVLRLDVQGAARIKQIYPSALLIFLTPGSEDELRFRLDGRETETSGRIETLVNSARKERERRTEFDYVVLNQRDKLDQTVKEVQEIVRAERLRVRERAVRKDET